MAEAQNIVHLRITCTAIGVEPDSKRPQICPIHPSSRGRYTHPSLAARQRPPGVVNPAAQVVPAFTGAKQTRTPAVAGIWTEHSLSTKSQTVTPTDEDAIETVPTVRTPSRFRSSTCERAGAATAKRMASPPRTLLILCIAPPREGTGFVGLRVRECTADHHCSVR